MSTSYKETLNLPKTDFPMKADLITREPARLARWEAQRLYHRILAAHAADPLFVLHDGPPFANGDVHMGTALNKILKDVIVKSKTMLDHRAPYVPGWDCHGLPIEFKVVKESRGLSPLEIRRQSEAYARKFIDIQRRQFRRLGVLGDWENPYLTLAPEYEAEIIRSFAVFVEKELVYQSKKPVYWSTGAQTALAEAEVEYADRTDPAIFVRFAITSGPLAEKAAMAIWTTTPWTLPANVAIAVHPRHRYVARAFEHAATGRRETLVLAEGLIEAFGAATGWTPVAGEEPLWSGKGEELEGTQTRHPFLERTSQVILADFVTLESGTGGVHIAPGHGSDDYLAGMKYRLPVLSPVDDRGAFTDEVGVPEWTGLYVFDANEKVVAHLEGLGALLGRNDYLHSYPHCWRSKTPVVFRAVEQFFIRIDAIRSQALEAIDNVSWLPHWGRNRIHGTVEARPDWCISRQRTWGVPLPVFYTPEGEPILDAAIARKVADLVERDGTNLWFEKNDAWWAQAVDLPEGSSRRNDTLDVWIDSGVSHTAVVKKHPELHFPADVYLEATDQHRGWFQSSLMTSVAMHDVAPYRTVITHGFVVDRDGKKISKSSSYKKPMDAEHFVGKYGADVVRLWVSSVQFTDEVPFSEEAFTRLGEAYRLFRNTLRILLANLNDFDAKTVSGPVEADPGLTTVDRWVLSRLQGVISTCREAYDAYEFRRVYQTLNQFCAVDLSALYIDITKDRMYCDAPDSPRRRATQRVMHAVFDALARLLAPILVYTADEAWEYAGASDPIHLESFPQGNPAWLQPEVEAEVETLLALRGTIAQAVEPARKEKLIGNALEADVTLPLGNPILLGRWKEHQAELEEFFILSNLSLEDGEENAPARLTRTAHRKCARCWRHKPEVGSRDDHPELCARCADVVAQSTPDA